MTLEQLAYLAEIVSSLAVVASLIYVARQLGQNSAMMRVAASNERVQRDNELGSDLVESRALTEVWLKGDSELEDLDIADRTRLMFFERRAILHWHNMFGVREAGLLPDADWHELRWAIKNFGRRQSVREAWRLFGESFEPPFRNFIQQEFAAADSAGAA